MLLLHVVVATYCYYEKACKTMHTAIVLYLIKRDSQPNEVCLGHKVKCTCLLDGGHVHNYLRYIRYQPIIVLKMKEKVFAVHQWNQFGRFIMSSHVGFHEERIRTVSNYELPSLVQHSYTNMAKTRSLCIGILKEV